MTIAKDDTYARYRQVLAYEDMARLVARLKKAALDSIEAGDCTEVGALKCLDDVLTSFKYDVGGAVADSFGYDFPL